MTKTTEAVSVRINSEIDIIQARQCCREIAEQIGFSGSELTIIATAVSELARNIIEYADRGEIFLQPIAESGRRGVAVIAKDYGPGIPDIERALQDGFSTGRGLGLGLPGVRRLMDEFEIDSAAGKGTTVSTKKWKS